MNIEIKTVKLSVIHLNPDNPRRISGPAMDRLVKSLQEFPEMLSLREIVVDETMTVLGGNMRLLALRQIGAKTVTAKIVTGLTEEQKREFVVKDNGQWGEWDFDLLSAWDDLPLADWGIKIPTAWTAPTVDQQEPQESQGLMRKNFNEGRGADEQVTEGGTASPDKYPVTFILDQPEWETWESVKEKMKLRDDKAAFLKMIGGKYA